MKIISVDEILILRQIRRRIVEICDCIYKQKWNLVNECLSILDLGHAKLLSEHCACQDVLDQCKICVQKKNALRLRDLLMQELDFRIANQLLMINEKDRKVLIKKAKEENIAALEVHHIDIWKLIRNISSMPRIKYAYIGTENVAISIKENNQKFRLFSAKSPWIEANDLVDSLGNGPFEEIHVLGFAGGYLIGELLCKFPDTKIKVYLPNIDIFKSVIDNIPVSYILKNRNVRFCYDCTCMLFILTVKEMLQKNKNLGVYIDSQEVRACRVEAAQLEYCIHMCKTEYGFGDIAKKSEAETVGRRIVQYINDVII